jgi:hypothetical protein
MRAVFAHTSLHHMLCHRLSLPCRSLQLFTSGANLKALHNKIKDPATRTEVGVWVPHCVAHRVAQQCLAMPRLAMLCRDPLGRSWTTVVVCCRVLVSLYAASFCCPCCCCMLPLVYCPPVCVQQALLYFREEYYLATLIATYSKPVRP